MLTKKEIIEDTLAYYLKNERSFQPRSNFKSGVEGVVCVYKTESGAMCAVGRWGNEQFPFDLIGGVEEIRDLDEFLVEEVRGHEVEFWDELQDFHDHAVNWNKTKTGNELSPMGIGAYETLLSRWF